MSDFDRIFGMLKKTYEYGVYTLEITKDNKKIVFANGSQYIYDKNGKFNGSILYQKNGLDR